MKLNNLILPHPVLGQGDDIESTSGLKDEVKVETKDDSFLFEFELVNENGAINDLINGNKVIYCCEANCPGTLFRETYLSTERKFSIEIPRTSVRNKVDFQIYCIATENIPNYSNPAAHEDFKDFIFKIEKADILGVFGSFSFHAGVQYHKLKAASSFMQIIPNETDKEYTEYVFDDSKILIKLPQVSYDKFKQDYIGKRKEFSDIIHASLVQNALTIALFNYQEHIENGNVWAASIQHRLLNEPDLNNSSDQFDHNQVPELVQKLLGNPNSRMIDQLEEISDSFI